MICVLCLALPGPAFAASELSFDASAQPSKLVLGGKNFLASDASTGFNLRYSQGREVTNTRLSQISRSGNTIKVSHPDGTPEFTLQIDTHPNHLAIHLLDAKGIGTGRNYSLSLELDATDVAAYTLNDLMTVNAGNQRSRGRGRTGASGNQTVLRWPYLWGRPRPNGTRGSVVLYDNRLGGSERDAVLAEIWSVQSHAGHMVRPAGQASWTPADVLAWVDRWAAKFSKLATVSVGAKNKAEVYEMTDKYFIPSGANRLYMFPSVWRGEYKLKHKSNEGVNTKVFPNGKSDLIAYSEYLAKHGGHLQLKSLVPQLGLNDQRYFSPTYVEPRLLSWGSGTLAEDIDPSATTIRFRRGPGHMWEISDKFTKCMRIGNEMIQVNKISGTDGELWTLTGCKRGHAGSTAKSHQAGTEMIGAVTSYDFFHFADDFGQPNSLAEEVLTAYGDFLNEMNVGHLHFDGTHTMPECPWYLRDYSDFLYSRLDQPVTGSIVGGSVPANFEKQFSKGKAISGQTAYHLLRIAPRLHERGRIHTELAPSALDLHFDVSDGVRIGSRRPTFCGGQSGKILTLEIMNHYGLSDYAFQLFKDWVELAPVFDEEDADYVAGFLQKRGNHYTGEDVLVLSKNEEGNYIYTPHRVMGQTSGRDPLISIDQEWGAVPRFQNIKSPTTLELHNPYAQQEPQVVIRVEHGSAALQDPLIKVNDGGVLSIKGEVQPNEYMKFEGGSTAQIYDNNWNLLRSLPAVTQSFTVNKGSNAVTTSAGRGSKTADLRVQFITLGPVYVLESNKYLQ
ncbi:hypothetical protein Q31b_39810 [Novipirellula aureliae]|uniref:Uncharacterized protein n=2 Tax=Novipirellula aureliae TaxID=2527966 RepID=A0A5C6DNN7_9BACT|nr:hypothetical protein Q31b_39810 [Novipirellula aureliae]